MGLFDALGDSAAYTVPALVWWAILFVYERLVPAGPLPRVRGWWLRLALVQVGMMGVGWLGSVTWLVVFPHVSQTALPWHPTLGAPWLDGAVAYVLSTFVFYWWHRLRHTSDLCWRLFHQMHHSPVRVEAATAFYSHPFEVLASSVVLAACVYGAGFDVGAYNYCTLYSACIGLFYHSNVRTPHAWSYVVQTPDLHRVHHQRGRHCGNYADLPVLDVLFGTFIHPSTFDGTTGFADEHETAFSDILRFRDVNRGSPGRL